MKSKKLKKSEKLKELQPATDTVKDESPYIYQRDKINFDLSIRDKIVLTDKQKKLIEIGTHKDTRLLMIEGPAGSSKTFIAMRIALELLKAKRVSDIIMVRAAVESASSGLGFMPGDLSEKFGVYTAPFLDKLDELLTTDQISKLNKDNRIKFIPPNFMRGLSYNSKVALIDEAQNLTFDELRTILTRMGEYTRTIVCGDCEQSDLPDKKSGFKAVFKAFNTDEYKQKGIHCFSLGEEDIVRSEFCRLIVKEFKRMEVSRKEHKY